MCVRHGDTVQYSIVVETCSIAYIYLKLELELKPSTWGVSYHPCCVSHQMHSTPSSSLRPPHPSIIHSSTLAQHTHCPHASPSPSIPSLPCPCPSPPSPPLSCIC